MYTVFPSKAGAEVLGDVLIKIAAECVVLQQDFFFFFYEQEAKSEGKIQAALPAYFVGMLRKDTSENVG